MEPEDTIFQKKVPNVTKLLAYGFRKEDGSYIYSCSLRNGFFLLNVYVDVSPCKVTSEVLDTLTDEEYLPIRLEGARGEFIYTVRKEFENKLKDIAEKCFSSLPFLLPQTNRIVPLIEKECNVKYDYPFTDDVNKEGVSFRSNGKWFALILKVKENKIRKDGKEKDVEVLDLKGKEEEIPLLLKKKGFYPAYHMNKKKWFSILLEDEVKDEEILALVKESKRLTEEKNSSFPGEKREWLVPSNLAMYDLRVHWKNRDIVHWWQSKNMKVGDILYVYAGAPVQAILYRGLITKTDLDLGEPRKEIEVHLTDRYDPSLCPREMVMKEYGVTTVRGPRSMPKELSDYLLKQSSSSK